MLFLLITSFTRTRTRPNPTGNISGLLLHKNVVWTNPISALQSDQTENEHNGYNGGARPLPATPLIGDFSLHVPNFDEYFWYVAGSKFRYTMI